MGWTEQKQMILRRGGKNTQNYTKKDLNDPDNHDSVLTHLEPGILECKVNWTMRNITTNKASGGDGISAELFEILKDDAIYQQIWKTQQWPEDWKRSIFIPIPKKGNAKECSNYCTTALISHATKVLLKILQARLQQHINQELPHVQVGFRKGRGTRDQPPTFTGSQRKQGSFRKTSTSTSLTMLKPLTTGITTNC